MSIGDVEADMETSGPLFEPVNRAGLRYCVEVAAQQRLMVRIDAEGRLLIKGRREEIEALIVALRDQGVVATLEYLSFCG